MAADAVKNQFFKLFGYRYKDYDFELEGDFDEDEDEDDDDIEIRFTHLLKKLNKPASASFLLCTDTSYAQDWWPIPVNKYAYQFDNYIDIHNACTALQDDLLLEKANEDNQFFLQLLDTKYAALCRKIDRIKESYRDIFKVCEIEHQAPVALYNLALYEINEEKYLEALDHLKSLLNKINLDALEPNLASNVCHSKGEAEVEVAFYDEAVQFFIACESIMVPKI